nr:NAD(P)H-dependent 6'-deoxychalcone synthase isoform X2 [Arachis hypogaea]
MSSTKQVAIPNVVLQSSFSMPVIGFGTAAFETDDGDVHKQAVIEAIKVGYRHFDTASVYGSEQALGEAIAEALKLGLISSRDELFITSKLWLSDNHPDLVLPALRKSLQNLGLEYLDLYLIHWPMSAKPGLFKASYDDENDLVPFDLKGVWTSMEQCHKLGLAKSIGVSNFSINKLEHLLSFATIPPAVNQVSLRWLYEQGVTFAVKSYNKERMKQNLEIFDFSLTSDDYQKINQIKQTRKSVNNPTTFVVADLFDGEN